MTALALKPGTSKRLQDALALLYGPPISADERRRAAEGLGLADWLPDIQPELTLAKAG